MRGASFKRSFDKKALRVIVVGRTRIDRLSRVGEVSWKRTCSLSRRENRNRFLADHRDRNSDTQWQPEKVRSIQKTFVESVPIIICSNKTE